MPYRTLTGSVIDSGDFEALIGKAERASQWAGFAARRKAAARQGMLRGIGCSAFLEPSGGGASPKDQVAINVLKNGQIALYSTGGSSGQGHETVCPEVVAKLLGVDAERVVFRAGDPDGPQLVGNAAFGSRTLLSHGSAFKLAGDHVIEKARLLAADALETSTDDVEFHAGRFQVKGTDRVLSFIDVLEQHVSVAPHPLDTMTDLPIARAFPSGAHIVEIEIDPDTGRVRVIGYTAVDDIGNVLNHVLADGQLHGGVMQGAGQVFGEHCYYDRESGQLITGSFMDYAMPRADLIPALTVLGHVVPSPNNVLGAKGAGEAGTTGAVAAFMNAIVNALRSVGVGHFDMPATPARIWAALQTAKVPPGR